MRPVLRLRVATTADVPSVAALCAAPVRRLGPPQCDAGQVASRAVLASEDEALRALRPPDVPGLVRQAP